MAVKNCEELSNIISLGIVSGDEDLAKEIARLSEKKKQALVRAGKLGEGEEVDALTGWTAHELELKANSADIEMRAIVQAKILTNDVRVGDAYRELAEQIRKTGGTISSGVELLEKLRNASPADYKSIAQQWGGQYAKDPERAIKEMQEAIAETVSANYSIRQYSEIKSRGLEKLRKQLRDKEISQGIFEDEVKKLHKDAMEAIAKGENPKDFAKLDDEWASIKKIFGDDPLKAGKVWSQFIMARELLSDGAIDDGVLKAFADMGAENLTGPLTIDQIAKYGKDDLDKLLARAYTNTEQLYKDGNLRQVYREKLIELTSGMRVSKENIKKAQSIMNTMEFAEKGAAFSDVVTADNAVRSANKRGIKVKDGTQLIWGIKKFAEKLGEDPNILKEPIKIAGAEFKPIDLIQVIYDITGDENILKLLRLGFLSDSVILSVGTSRLLGGTKEAAERLLKIFSKAKEMPKVSSVRDISLKAITGIDIKEGAPMGFFDFRTPLYKKDKLNRSKADLYDKIANKNKMRVDSTNITYIQETDDVNTLVTELKKYKGGYVIVNDSQFRANDVLSQALDIVNDGLKDEEKVWALFPRGGNSSSFIMEDGQLYFKTLYDDIFDDVAGTISIQSLGEAKPTREILATAYEAATGKNGDKIRYQASYSKGGADNLGRQISDQQVEYFSNSKVRDENGNLIRVYHGRSKQFDVFDIEYARKEGDIQGFFLSEYRETSEEYGPDIIECYLNITNPAPRREAYEVFGSFEGQNNRGVLAREELQRRGYDGVQSDSGEWIAFSPEQIKYVDNRLPTADPNMHFQFRDKEWTIKDIEDAVEKGEILFHSTSNPNLTKIENIEELRNFQKKIDDINKKIQSAKSYKERDDLLLERQRLRENSPDNMWVLDGLGQRGARGGEGFYVTSRPYERQNVMSQQGLDLGDNIYAIYIPGGVREHIQAAGLGYELPEAIINEGVVLGRVSNDGDLIGETKRLLNLSYQRRLGQYINQVDVSPDNAMKVQLFTKDRTWAQIAEAYGFPVRIVQGNMIEGTAAYGAWGNGMIYFTDMVKESTAPHELFHAVFNTYVGKEQYDRVLADATKLFQVSAYDAEEILADSFAEWFKTGKFTYGDNLKKLTGLKRLNKTQKSFLDKVLQAFKDLAEMLGILDNHRAEVEQMFNDIVNCNYLPNVGKNVDATAAMIKYNDELDATAARYFGEMLGEDVPENIDKEYIDRIQTKLSERLGIDIKAFSEIQGKSALWKKIDQQFALDKITTGKYDRQVVDINSVKNEIAGYTDDELEKAIKKDLGDVLIRGTIKGNNNIDHIREAYLDYKMAGTAADSLMAKGKIVSLANGGTAQTMSMQDIRNMFTNGNFKDTYKRMFLSNQTLTDKEMNKFVNAINDNIFDTLSVTFAENLVAAGYSLPLINIKTFIYDYLRGNLDLNNKFVEAFLYKNKIPFTSDGLKSIVDSLMPTSFKFDYEDALFKGRFGGAEQGQATVVKETKNRFLQDSYSAIASIEMARAGNMPVNQEEEILKNILDKYIKEVSDGVKAGTLTFQQSQGLKQEAGYALDMFEQDFLLPRYGRFLSKQEKEGLIGMKYLLPIGVKGQNIDELNKELVSIRNKIVNKYETTLGGVARNNDINMSIARGLTSDDKVMQEAINRRRDQLMNNGGVIKEVNGQYLVYDVKEALALTIAQMPKNVGLSETIIGLGRDGIEGLSNRQAYALLRYLEAAKGLNATANLATELIYKQNPALLRYNFFQSYRVGADGIPMALEGNLLTSDKFLSKFDNIGGLDTTAKKNIFDGIVSKFRSQGYLTKSDLDNIIDKGISDAQASFRQVKFSPKDVKKATNNMKLIYKKVFEPYVHVRDIPKGGTLIDGRTKVTNVKAKVAEAMRQQYNQAVNDLKAMGVDDFTNLNDAIYITTSNGDKISLREAGEMTVDSRKKSIFNDESVFVAGADELKKFEGNPDDEALVGRQKVWRESIISQYDSNLQAMLNQTQYISKAEADLSTAFMNDVRTTMRQSTLTNKIVDALDALSGLNEEAARGIKDYLIGWRGNMTFGKWTSGQILKRNELVKEAYKKYYYLDISKLNSVVPTTKAEDLALRLAKYFKNLERLLGSVDGLTGCTTSQQLNRAFYHIGETVMNVDTVKGVFGLLSGVEQNQILKFFKFAKGDLRKQADIFIRSGKGNFQEGFGGYRDYAEDISGISREDFNQIFASNFSENDFKRILQGLTGFSLTGAWGRMGMKILNILNSSNFLFRFLMSYPGQLLTIPQQSLAYFLKQIGFEREMGVESMSEVDSVRAHYGILDGAYNELGRWGKSTVSPDDIRLDSYYNRYGIPDVDEIYKTSSIETSDDYINMYAKIDQHAASSVSATSKWFRQLDPYKDNANNIIDGLFARNFKNISFLKALRGNDFLQFGSAKEFMSFMDDPTISAEVKTRLMDRVASYSGRNFRNILGLGFGGIDRAVAGGGFGNIMYGLMQLLNFRGSWGQNIFKQTGANMFTALKMLAKGRWSDEGKAAIAEYIARQPEFTNFIGALFNDLRWTWKLQRFQDNGRWPDDNSFYDAMDFIEYMTDTLNMTSQRWQGLQSFGPLRPILEWGGSAFMSAMNPTIYKDTFGVGAFINALGKNVGRQWKPYNWIVKWIGAWRTDGPEGAMAYLESEWWKLSFGSLRFMVNEDMNAYGYTYEITGQTGGIPSILMGESRLGSDKNFSYEIDNSETWESLRQVFDSDIPWDDRWTYLGNIGKAFVNGSQLMSMPKNIRQAYKRESPSYFTADNLSEYIQKTDAGLEFYRRGIVTPKTPQEAKIFFDTMLANSQYRPGSSSFTKSLINYENYGHMDGKKGKKADAQMELWLDHMKHLTNKNGEFETSGGQKVVDPSWNKLIEDVKIHGYNQTYTTKLIYNYAKNWLNNHSSDPNYQLYIKMLGQGQAHNLIENKTEQLLEVLNYGKKKADNRWTETEFENVGLDINLLLRLGNSKIEGENVTLFDKLQVLDEDDATVAALQIIKDQSKGDDRKVLDRFFDVEEQEDGSKVITLKYNYEQTLKQIGAVAKALDSGDVDLALAEASTLTNMYKQADPTGAVTATIIDSIYNRVYDSDTLTPSQKQAIMTSLFHKNKDFIQRNPEKLREILGDSYNIYADYMNSMLYQWDSMTISNLESMQSSGDSSSGKAKSAGDLSSAFKKLANEIGGGQSNAGTRSTGSYKEWVPVVIKGADLVKELGLKGYTPEVNDLKVQSYKPHSDFSLAKDINRSVKWPKTQAVTKKKQLSKLETDVEKALEAES